MNKKLILTLLFYKISLIKLLAQTIDIESGSAIFISANTSFYCNGLTLLPSSNFNLTGVNTLTKNTTLVSAPGPTYVSRVYLFDNSTGNFSGTIQINYEDSELNGLTESTLELNNYNGSTWSNHSSATNNTSSNFVLSNALNNVTLKELTLAGSSAPLPVSWLEFSISKQLKSVLLNWSTAQEINNDVFEIQRSNNGIDFKTLDSIKGAGTTSIISKYSFWDFHPLMGNNFYRIKQKDYDGKISFSPIRKINFNTEIKDIIILTNPIEGDILKIKTNEAQTITLYDISGKIIKNITCNEAITSIDISNLGKGVYYLRSNLSSIKILIL